MSQVCDFSNQSIDLNAVKANGFAGVISYASDAPNPKNWTLTNFLKAQELGMTVGVVCEQGQQQSLRGTLGGMHDSTIMKQQCDALGYFNNACEWYVAEDPSRLPITDYPTVVQYFQGLAWAGSPRPRGAYGGLQLVTHLIDQGLVTYGWVVQTWGGTNSQVHLEQLVGAPTHGLPIDVDAVLKADYGQGSAIPPPIPPPDPPKPPAPPPPTIEESDMITVVENGSDGHRHVYVYDETAKTVTHWWQNSDGTGGWNTEVLPGTA